MQLHGKQFIGSKTSADGGETFRGFDPSAGRDLDPVYHEATADEVDRAMRLAETAFEGYRRKTPQERARFLVAIGEEIDAIGDALVERAVLSDNGKRNLTFAEIQRLRGIPVDSPGDPNSGAGLDLVKSFAPDVILSIRYGAIIKAPVLGIPPLGVLNLHSGILPAYRGILPTFRAMMQDDAEIGCTLHYIRDASIDTGDIVSIHRRPLQRERSLLRNVLDHYPAGIEMIRSALQTLERGAQLSSSTQHNDEAAYYTYPTPLEWDEFTRRGWRVADPSDLQQVMLGYLG